MSENNKEEFIFFWKNSPFSQFYRCSFTINNQEYNCAEQYMMYQKAILFNDKDTANKIIKTINPNEIKKLGREVKNFDEQKWINNRESIVVQGNIAKFTQNSKLLDQLFKTNGKTLVEASPYDKIWGIGLSSDNPKAQDRTKWLGMNLLGKILTEIRDEL